jgi:hypothetical protein
MGQSLRILPTGVAMVEDRDGIAGKDHTDRQSDGQPETTFLCIALVVSFDIFAHLFIPFAAAGALPTCRMLCRDRAISRFCCISDIF